MTTRGISASHRRPAWLWLGVLGLALVAALLSGAAGAQQTDVGSFEFALIGDLGYNPAQEPLFRNVMADLNATPSLAFVIHDGDLWSGAPGCTDERFQERFALLNSSVHPLIYTPGDNEWTDCHSRGHDPVDRLQLIRRLFFADDSSLGQRRISLTRQSASNDPAFRAYRENARWTQGGVTFLTLHVVGSNNNLGRTPEADAEYVERNAANLAWLGAGFEYARATDSRGIMVVWQANPFFERARERRTAFNALLDLLEEETVAFGRPVVLVHGDTHYFRIDKPLRGSRSGQRIENFTRVETFGQPDHHWLHVTVDPSDPNLFTFRQKLVEANLVDHR